ncbi:two-component system cell cycle response regulator [Albidovulum inexpectatum]|uniref:diguanylate cyclase n=1 Tax=Albidovulum inexpectatum TaxID=196587 RepID=A0A2S5JFC5_9RHOB|nr:diguanylate cyclase [Albidovulum inexpectatum]PPB80216.1 two-component system cell cycle response regulator [Albidovulum inexpectatum]
MGGRILIVDDVGANRFVMMRMLSNAFYEPIEAASGHEALALARDTNPDLVLLDIEMPDLGGIATCQKLKADPRTAGIPVVMVTAYNDVGRKMQALRAGAEDVIGKPINETVLLARIRSLLRARETERQLGLRESTYREFGFAEPPAAFAPRARVVIVGPAAPELARSTSPHLDADIVAANRESILRDSQKGRAPDAFVVALGGGGSVREGLMLIAELRARAETRHAAICVHIAGLDEDDRGQDAAAMALDLGANDLIEPDATPEEIAYRIRAQIDRKLQADRLRASVETGLRLAMTDPLTGLHNRRYAMPHLQKMADAARREGRRIAVMVLDIDRFKSINDTHGHAAGDAVLVEIADRLRSNLRAADLIARLGGEEFLVALPDTTPEAAQATAERLRRVIAARPVPLPRGEADISVTLSIGLALGPTDSGIEDLIDRADRALLGSKSAGRNQVTIGQTA